MIHRLDDKNIYVGNQAIDRVYLGEELLKSNEPPIYLAQDSDFVKIDGNWIYKGDELEIEIPHVIQGEAVTSLDSMFRYGRPTFATRNMKKVVSTNRNVTSMASMFNDGGGGEYLDLSELNSENVTNTRFMFANDLSYDIIDFRNFDASKVTNVRRMLYNDHHTTFYFAHEGVYDTLRSVASGGSGPGGRTYHTYTVAPD